MKKLTSSQPEVETSDLVGNNFIVLNKDHEALKQGEIIKVAQNASLVSEYQHLTSEPSLQSSNSPKVTST